MFLPAVSSAHLFTLLYAAVTQNGNETIKAKGRIPQAHFDSYRVVVIWF